MVPGRGAVFGIRKGTANDMSVTRGLAHCTQESAGAVDTTAPLRAILVELVALIAETSARLPDLADEARTRARAGELAGDGLVCLADIDREILTLRKKTPQ
jgi:hypothetical protein